MFGSSATAARRRTPEGISEIALPGYFSTGIEEKRPEYIPIYHTRWQHEGMAPHIMKIDAKFSAQDGVRRFVQSGSMFIINHNPDQGRVLKFNEESLEKDKRTQTF